MAKKKKNANNEFDSQKDEEKIGSKILSGIIVLLIVVVWLAILAVLIKADVGHFGSKVLRPVLKDVPVINKILPAASDEETAAETDYPYTNLADALERIRELENQNATLQAQVASDQENITDKDNEIARLKVFETNQTEFQATKDEFYQEIVYGNSAPDADTYIEWYNSLDPEAAEEIYRQVLGDKEVSQEMKDLASSYTSMKPEEAAAILQKMSNDLDSVARILSSMSAADRGAIMGKMDADFAANVTKKLLP